MDLLNAYARPVSNRILVLIDRWYRSGDLPAPDPGSLWRASEQAHADGDIPARDSLMAPLQLGRRLLPDPRTPLRLARHLTAAGVRAAQLAPVLTRPHAERRRSAHDEARPARTDDAAVSVWTHSLSRSSRRGPRAGGLADEVVALGDVRGSVGGLGVRRRGGGQVAAELVQVPAHGVPAVPVADHLAQAVRLAQPGGGAEDVADRDRAAEHRGGVLAHGLAR